MKSLCGILTLPTISLLLFVAVAGEFIVIAIISFATLNECNPRITHHQLE